MFWPVARHEDDEGPKRRAAGGGAGPRAPVQVDDGLLEGLLRCVVGGDAVESDPDGLGRRILRDKQVGIPVAPALRYFAKRSKKEMTSGLLTRRASFTEWPAHGALPARRRGRRPRRRRGSRSFRVVKFSLRDTEDEGYTRMTRVCCARRWSFDDDKR